MTAEASTIASILLKHHREVCTDFKGATPESITDTMVQQSVIFYGRL
jgi:hypothetical protein